MVPQLIPRDPVNMKSGFNSIRTNISNNIDIEFDPTTDAPIAVFDGKIIFKKIIFLQNSFLKMNQFQSQLIIPLLHHQIFHD